MLALRQNIGRVLEPSCGNGAFSVHLSDCVAIELDSSHAPVGSLNMDFFAYSTSNKFDTIIGNPPYVRYQDILPTTQKLLNMERFDFRSNLYLFFIEKCIHHLKPNGEIIFITPRDFIKSTSSIKLNQWLFQQGTITHAIELGDAKVFSKAVPNCLIWRFQKGLFDRTVNFFEVGNKDNLKNALKNPLWETRKFVESAGHLMFSKEAGSIYLRDIARVKVGAVSGADAIYANEQYGNVDFVCSATAKNGKTRKMVWVDNASEISDYLIQYKDTLIQRKIRRFDESNWWQWGRGYPKTTAPRIYVNGKTRNQNPFFTHPCNHFDGSVLAIFPINTNINIVQLCQALNSVNWEQLGFVCDGRFLFTQRSLENAPLSEFFNKYK